ncbi:4-hydroxy-3-methylbut-2-en-1-yl diphosphate synthase [Marinilabiliaceae bacterium JC017]|nr:4-hydroxy-3-methylbut-2-en-1-yl diphosphate synthase [Marinilabiliaceae bacterium JC017]
MERASNTSYCENLFQYKKNPTCSVHVGQIEIGGDNPIRIQSMTTTNTLDTEGTAQQAIRIIEAGGELVRVTTQGRREARNMEAIKAHILEKGYDTPLVADIHFNPNAATIAAQLIEKVRINPGNFTGGAKKFEQIDYTDACYQEELKEVESKLVPFLNICKEHHTAVRIGTNHGSLSDRIMSRFGDTPEGMVESCLEYLRLCKAHDFNDIVLSIKSSNTRIMVHTVRLLVARMKEEKMNFPLHLGVTEAGSEDEGRIKSAVGSGALLVDGLGDTIRVSLTEEPENEIPVAKKLVAHIVQREGHAAIEPVTISEFSPYSYQRRESHEVLNTGKNNVPVVIADIRNISTISFEGGQLPEYALCSSFSEASKLPEEVKAILPYEEWKTTTNHSAISPLVTLTNYKDFTASETAFFMLSYPELSEKVINFLKQHPEIIVVLTTNHINGPVEQRTAIFKMNQYGLTHPVILHQQYEENEKDDFQIKAAADTGILFLDGLADGLMLSNQGTLPLSTIIETQFGILQASRVRFSKTEFISCPGCGRTLFDLQETARQIKARTSHLKGLKIGIMGCIVNGVGEMADADYGYIGSGPDKVSLFKNRELIQKNIPRHEAVDALINLIKENGDWVDS